MPELRKSGAKLFTKEIISKGYGFHTPQDGSVCKIRIIKDENNSITDLDDCNEKEIVVGDIDEPIDRILEDCIRTMKEEEECLLKFVHPFLNDDIFIPEDSHDDATANVLETAEIECKKDEDPTSPNENLTEATINECNKGESQIESDSQNDDNAESKNETVSQDNVKIEPTSQKEEPENKSQSIETDATQECIIPSGNNHSKMVEIHFQLLSYTREPEIWEMSVTEKWRRASYHKQRGLELYSRGAYQYAFRRFGLTLKYVISLEHDIPSGQEEEMDIRGLKLSCYLNVAACQMRHHNFESVVINSTKALSLQPNNAKALYRRGSALLQLQEFEKAKEDLGMAQQLEPKNQAIAKQQQLLKSQVQKLNQYYATAMKKLFA